MSQEKVDKYKQEKAGRQQQIKKQKRNHKIRVAAISVAALVLAGWVGYSVYDKIDNRQLETIYFDMSALDDYIEELTAE